MIGLVGNFIDGIPQGKVIKFFINPLDKKLQILDQGVMSNGEIKEQKVIFEQPVLPKKSNIVPKKENLEQKFEKL